MFNKNYKNSIIEIQNEKIGLGESKLIKIPVDRLPTGTLIEIPIYVFNGKKPGPTILLQGGLHGDEVNGIEIIRRMLINKTYKIYKGCVIVIPLLNVFGFLNLSRDMHGKDVNRSFPGSKNGSLAGRMAYYLMRDLVKGVDFGIDFHTGGEQRFNYPQIRFTPSDERGKALALIFKAPITFGSKLIPKSFRNECNKYNIPIIVYEGGESLRLSEFAIQEGINGTLRVLKHFDMISSSVVLPSEHTSVEIEKRRWIRAKIAGLFSSKIKNGSFVKKGQVIGLITDTYGAINYKIKAPDTGFIIAINNFPIVNMGDALFHFGET